jgi:hypothetical protein
MSSGDNAALEGAWPSSILVLLAKGPDRFGEFPVAAGELAVDSRLRSIESDDPFVLFLLFVVVAAVA